MFPLYAYVNEALSKNRPSFEDPLFWTLSLQKWTPHQWPVQFLHWLGCHGDTRDKSAETLFESFLQEALVSRSGMDRDVHSLMLTIQYFLCQPRRRPPYKMSWRMVLERLSWLVTCPICASFHLLTIARRGSFGQTRKLILFRIQTKNHPSFITTFFFFFFSLKPFSSDFHVNCVPDHHRPSFEDQDHFCLLIGRSLKGGSTVWQRHILLSSQCQELLRLEVLK